MAAAEIKKLCCLVHNTADEPRFEKKKNTIHNAARSPDLVGLYKTMRGSAELQNHILKEEGCTVLTRALTANYGKEKNTGKSLTFHPNVTLLVIMFVGC
jgi:hypothetical protein